MKKNLTKLLSLALVVMLCMVMAVPAMALPLYDGTLEGGVVEVDKELQLDANALVPAVEFTFTLAPVANASDMHGFVGRTGIMTGIKISGDITADTTTSLTSEAAATIKVKYDQGNQPSNTTAIRKGMLFDFTSVNYPNPGVYRYTLEEVAGSRADITYSTTTYYIDVYVIYDETDSRLELGSVIVSSQDDYALGDTKNKTNDDYTDVKADEKADATPKYDTSSSSWTPTRTSDAVFENPLKTCDLKLTKTVAGNQGSHNEYFDFTVSFTGVAAGTYNYTGPGTNDKGTITVDGNGTVTAVTGPAQSGTSTNIKLKHNEGITFENLPYGAKYTIAETYGDYTPSASPEGTKSNTTYTVTNSTDTTGLTADTTTVAYTNTKEGTIPTGILLTIAPFAVLMVVGAAGVLFFVLKKKRS